MDLLKAEIEAKRKELEKLATGKTDGKRFAIRRADLERQREEQYLEEERNREEERQKRLQEKLSAKKIPQKAYQENEQISDEMNAGIERMLRQLGEPIRLFGESDMSRSKRLKAVKSRQEEKAYEGQRNEFMETVWKLQEEENREDSEKHQQPPNTPINTENSTSTSLGSAMDVEPINRALLSRHPEAMRAAVELYLSRLMLEWETSLDERSEGDKQSTAGRVATATQKQAVQHLRPFLADLRANKLPPDVLGHIVQICDWLQQREYVRANDIYLRLAIGNAPWPIGVTMVGIHERSAREKISSSEVAHVLNDEVSRKWIQAIKRLMTFCQKTYPPSDPAKAMG